MRTRFLCISNEFCVFNWHFGGFGFFCVTLYHTCRFLSFARRGPPTWVRAAARLARGRGDTGTSGSRSDRMRAELSMAREKLYSTATNHHFRSWGRTPFHLVRNAWKKIIVLFCSSEKMEDKSTFSWFEFFNCKNKTQNEKYSLHTG